MTTVHCACTRLYCLLHFYYAEITVAHNCHAKTKNLTAKPKTSRQKQKPHGKPKNLTAKTKYVTKKPKPSQQNQRPHGKTKYFTAKTKYLTAKANTHGKTKAILFLQ